MKSNIERPFCRSLSAWLVFVGGLAGGLVGGEVLFCGGGFDGTDPPGCWV